MQQALQNVAKSRTTIVIAHRLSTVRDADNVVVMSKGTVIEQGTHDELVSKGGSYAKLVTSQYLGDGQDAIVLNREKETLVLASDPELVMTPNSETADAGEADESSPVFDQRVSYGIFKGMMIVLKEQRPLRIPTIATVLSAIIAGKIHCNRSVDWYLCSPPIFQALRIRCWLCSSPTSCRPS